MAWGPGPSASYPGTWRGSRWWLRKEGTTNNPYVRREGWIRGYPLSPTIFNVVVDAFVRHWESMIAEGGGCDVRDNSSGDEAAHSER